MTAFCFRTGKVRHGSPGEAERARNKDRKKRHNAIYRCSMCGGYHLGRSRESEQHDRVFGRRLTG